MEQRVRRKLTAEFKAQAVELVRSSGKPVAQVFRELDLTENGGQALDRSGPGRCG